MSRPFGLFERFGVELEYMIVDARSLSVRPCADRLIELACGDPGGDVERGPIGWSNELALHVIELKTARPATRLEGLADRFQQEVASINRLLSSENARLLPTAMHPWMNPRRESRLWPHECGEIYQAFHRIFDCRGHGWTNLQSAHLNLPFSSDDEFARLHTAIRLVLPILPALAASSPFVNGRRGPLLDMRLRAYRENCARVPSVTGDVVPELVSSEREYREAILERIYRDLAPLDPDGVLRHEWANARGAIARFERMTIEIRVLDVQECPARDLAVLQAIVAVLRALVEGKISSFELQRRVDGRSLGELLRRVTKAGGRARARDSVFLEALGWGSAEPCSVRELWSGLMERCAPDAAPWRGHVADILEKGCLSERILAAAGGSPSRRQLREVYQELADCLDDGRPFGQGRFRRSRRAAKGARGSAS